MHRYAAQTSRNSVSRSLLWLLMLLQAGCATTPDVRSQRDDAERRREQAIFTALTRKGLARTDSVRTLPGSRIERWNDLDDYNIVVTGRGREQYLITFSIRCADLGFATGISTGSAMGSLAVNDSLIVTMMNGALQRCRVSEITRLEALSGFVEE